MSEGREDAVSSKDWCAHCVAHVSSAKSRIRAHFKRLVHTVRCTRTESEEPRVESLVVVTLAPQQHLQRRRRQRWRLLAHERQRAGARCTSV